MCHVTNGSSILDNGGGGESDKSLGGVEKEGEVCCRLGIEVPIC